MFPVVIAEAHARLQLIDERWDSPTPCEGWSVRDLATHLVNGSRMSITLFTRPHRRRGHRPVV